MRRLLDNGDCAVLLDGFEEPNENIRKQMVDVTNAALHHFVERILATAADKDLTSLARAVGVLGRILRILAVYDYQPSSRFGWGEARDRVMNIFTLEGASRVPVEQRIAAAETLGQAGDPRINSLVPEMLPAPGMDGVLLGKYPVTVAEYHCFIESNGYMDRQHWEEKWWSIKKREGWTKPKDWDEQLEHKNRPVTGISWYEAAAYCNWLVGRTNLPYRLPREKEWEKAATNPNGEYPWGNAEPNPDLLNFDENVGVPTPVGIYPAGAAAAATILAFASPGLFPLPLSPWTLGIWPVAKRRERIAAEPECS